MLLCQPRPLWYALLLPYLQSNQEEKESSLTWLLTKEFLRYLG